MTFCYFYISIMDVFNFIVFADNTNGTFLVIPKTGFILNGFQLFLLGF